MIIFNHMWKSKGIKIQLHIKKTRFVRNWNLKTLEIIKETSKGKINQVQQKLWFDKLLVFTQRSEEMGAFRRNFEMPRVTFTIFKQYNINSYRLSIIQLFENILGH